MNTALELIRRTTAEVPSVAFTLGHNFEGTLRHRLLARWLWQRAEKNGTVHLHPSGQGILLYYPSVGFKTSLLLEITTALLAVGLRRLPLVYRRKRAVDAWHKKHPNHLYCSFLGVASEARNGDVVRDLRDHLFAVADQKQVPVVIEATHEKNTNVYKRIGFDLETLIEQDGLITYCLVRYPKSPPAPR